MDNKTVPDEALDLYGLPPNEFTSARNELVRSLEKQGLPDEASTVRALKKPNLAAWAINQIARSHRQDLEELLAVTERMKGAGNTAEVREAIGDRHRRVRGLVDAARKALEVGGHSAGAGTIQQITQTLYAAHSDREREQIARGALERPIESSGFDDSPGLALDTGPVEEVADKDVRERERLETELSEAEEQAAQLQRQAESARLAADQAEDVAAKAHRRVMRVRDKLQRLQK